MEYRHLSTILAPKGAYYVEGDGLDTTVYPVMYIGFWLDNEGVVWPVPQWESDVRDWFAGNRSLYRTFSDYIDDIVRQRRSVEQCMTCIRFIELCKKSPMTKENIIGFMEEICDYVISGEIATTHELRNYFKNGQWGDLTTMENDGSLHQGWKEDIARIQTIDSTQL